MVRKLFKLTLVAGALYGAKRLYDMWSAPVAPSQPWGQVPSTPAPRPGTRETAPGTDTATGTDPAAKYDRPGYEDKSFGQAVDQDRALVDRLVDEEHGDLDAAGARFEHESAGAPALARQHSQAPR